MTESTEPGLDMVDIRRKAFRVAFGPGTWFCDEAWGDPDFCRLIGDSTMERRPEEYRLAFDIAVAAHVDLAQGRPAPAAYQDWCERCAEARRIQASFA